ncbi:MAG: mechanosensitive ion channel family protein [Chloroflexi bacterium]|nr:mechanosensitive ion channel family protein [Chloroflexota bacterium]MDA8189741.1 mechanosensitive ion channel [Dehalococcoidales bacterium]
MDFLSLPALTIDWQTELTTTIIPVTIKVAVSVVVLLLTLHLAGRARRASQKSLTRTKADPSIVVFIGRLAHIGVLAAGTVIILGIMGISWTALLAVVGAISLAISLAIQDVLKNFVAGLYLLIERPFRVGETIKIKDFEGKVEDIGIRTTILRTGDGLQVVVPNAIVFTEVVVNISGEVPTLRPLEPAPHGAEVDYRNPQG